MGYATLKMPESWQFCGMYPDLKLQLPRVVKPKHEFARLQRFLLGASFLNLLIVACLGLVMRSYPFTDHPVLNYKFLVHAHSHFAFGGWAMPILLWLFMQYFPEVRNRMGYRSWRNLVFLSLFAAYGMLLSFPFQGYGPVSIFFSTLCVVRDFYFAVLVWKHTRQEKENVAIRFIRAGLFYLVISAAGPFATGPLTVMGKMGTPLYFDVIYFYLHFQYNGWFMFCLFGLFYRVMENAGDVRHGKKVFQLMNAACIPTYFLSVLWNQPGWAFNLIGAAGAVLQIAAIASFFAEAKKAFSGGKLVGNLAGFAISALAVKFVLQLLSALPYMAGMAYQNRNLIIAYLHLVLLGVFSMAAFALVLNAFPQQRRRFLQWGLIVFVTAFITTESILVLSVTGLSALPAPAVLYKWLFYLTALFPTAAIIMFRAALTMNNMACTTGSSFENYGAQATRATLSR